MIIGGEWALFDDDVSRPIIRGEIPADDGSWIETYFLVDTGADRTVFNAVVLSKLDLDSIENQTTIGEISGLADSVTVATQIRLNRENNTQITFRSEYAAVTELETLDFCVLGRDIINLFTAIFDQPNNFIGLIVQNHTYEIKEKISKQVSKSFVVQ